MRSNVRRQAPHRAGGWHRIVGGQDGESIPCPPLRGSPIPWGGKGAKTILPGHQALSAVPAWSFQAAGARLGPSSTTSRTRLGARQVQQGGPRRGAQERGPERSLVEGPVAFGIPLVPGVGGRVLAGLARQGVVILEAEGSALQIDPDQIPVQRHKDQRPGPVPTHDHHLSQVPQGSGSLSMGCIGVQGRGVQRPLARSGTGVLGVVVEGVVVEVIHGRSTVPPSIGRPSRGLPQSRNFLSCYTRPSHLRHPFP